MKIYKTISVELMNYDTFTEYPGAAEFKKVFDEEKVNEWSFRFYDESRLAHAEKTLKKLKLSHKIYYGIEVSEKKLSEFPVFAAGPLVEYDLIEKKSNSLKLNFKKIGRKTYLKDFATNTWIIAEKLKPVFENFCPHIKFKKYTHPTNGSNFYVMQNIKELKDPMIIVHAESILESTGDYKGTFYPGYSDGRVSFTEQALRQIENENLCEGNQFVYEGRKYKQAATHVFVSGKLTEALLNVITPNEEKANLIHAYPIASYFKSELFL